MDPRLHNGLEKWLGQPLSALPPEGIRLLESAARTEPHNQFLALRLPGRPGVLATATPRALCILQRVIARMDPLELLSPLGIAEIRRALGLPDAEPINHYFSYTLGDKSRLRQPAASHPVQPLHRKDIPAADFDRRMRERHPDDGDDFTWAFGCFDGPTLVCCAAMMWSGSDGMALDVETEPSRRGRGYASCATHAAALHALQRGTLVNYGAEVTNVPSLRIPRRLGFEFAYESLLA